MKRKGRRIAQVAISICVLGVAILFAFWLIVSKEDAQRSEPEERKTLVEVLEVEAKPMTPELSFRGTLRPARRLRLPAQVGGEVVWVNEKLEVGGLIDEGEELVRLEAADYRATLQQAEAQLAEAIAQLELERGRQSIAREELEFYRERDTLSESELKTSLVLREPQLNRAQAAAMRAEAAVAKARLNLERTRMRAPFDCIVEEEMVEVGQSLNPGSPVATLLGTRRGLVEARVAVSQLQHLRVPGWNGQAGSTGEALYRHGSEVARRQAVVLRLAGTLDPAGRMARLILEVRDPLGRAYSEGGDETSGEEALSMLFGAFVEIRIPVSHERQLVALPDWALQDEGRVFVMNERNVLEIREPKVFLRGVDKTYVSDGLQTGDRVVTSLIANPIEGMALKLDDGEGT
ncbi:HlyD family efflux transporter periplasmic adaptor subunit [Pelagicoccus sp. SDUM812003]|uniref:efflux RND transporter periplasmic adaptor subunit n=1 Tax=Pelagicoccus sp. SDUM812003 TaxID=3041267 RepID=UPI00280D8913|nr:HlyD family efflux transporter periplasmic adaptor subunit [Pelagicoccus sp. SDUM812003]MDQ8204008.1 HlyD family efflux transporter periplasmic adaptor subunit [Pelagicoccus sp. SDUM812003]